MYKLDFIVRDDLTSLQLEELINTNPDYYVKHLSREDGRWVVALSLYADKKQKSERKTSSDSGSSASPLFGW